MNSPEVIPRSTDTLPSDQSSYEIHSEESVDLDEHELPSLSVESTEIFHLGHEGNPGKPIIRVLIPIVVTLFLVCVMVTISCHNRKEQCYAGSLSEMPFGGEKMEQDSVTRAKNATITALAFLLFMAVATFAIFVIIYFRFTMCFSGYAVFALPLILSCFTLMLLQVITSTFDMPADWISIGLLTWNIVGLGIFSFICITPPQIIRQLYLIYISALISHLIILLLPPFTAWALLVVLILWDLFAVLAPCGPLRMIVQLLQKQRAAARFENNLQDKSQTQIPPLLIYSTMAFCIFSSSQDHLDTETNTASFLEEDYHEPITPSMDPYKLHRVESFRPQLGLGDFIFYSLLVGKTLTATYNMVTVLFVSVSIVFGLITTLFLLFAYRKALPALPISLTIALLVFFVMHLYTETFCQSLNVHILHI